AFDHTPHARVGRLAPAVAVWQQYGNGTITVGRMEITVRPARTKDMQVIRSMVQPLAGDRVLLDKDKVAYFEAVQEFLVAENPDGDIVGFGALHVMWEDLAERSEEHT